MREYGQYCALARALDHVGQRWTLLIVRELLVGPRRFSDLRDALPGIANNLLAERLRQLRDDGLVVQRRLPPPAASAVYELTPRGRALRESVDALIRWGGTWMTTGPRGDAFRPHWLTLALSALGVGRRVAGTKVFALHVAGEEVRLVVADGQVLQGEADAVARAPDVQVTAEAPTLLGLAAGFVPLPSAVRALSIDPDDDDARRLFELAFAPEGAKG